MDSKCKELWTEIPRQVVIAEIQMAGNIDTRKTRSGDCEELIKKYFKYSVHNGLMEWKFELHLFFTPALRKIIQLSEWILDLRQW